MQQQTRNTWFIDGQTVEPDDLDLLDSEFDNLDTDWLFLTGNGVAVDNRLSGLTD